MGSKMVERNARAFSGKVDSGFRQKMRPPKESSASVRQLRRTGGTTELASRLPARRPWLVDGDDLVSVPGRAHRVGYPCHLLLELAVDWPALGVGNRLCGVRDLGCLGVAATAHVHAPWSCCISAWSRGGYPSRPRTTVNGGRKSR